MNIDKSRIINKTIRDIVPTFIDEVSHKTWRKLPTSTINLLSRCILRYANSYGTTYQISQTKELTIVSNKGQSYILESYTKFLDLIIVDYQDPSEDKPMKIIKQSSYQIGDKVKIREDLKEHHNTTSSMCRLAGTIVTITGTKGRSGDGYQFKNDGSNYWSADMFEGLVIEDTQPTPADVKVGTHWECLKDFKGFGGYKAGEIVTLTKVTGTYVDYSDSRRKSIEDFLKTFKPRPDLDTPYAEALQQVDESLTVLSKNKPKGKNKPVAQPEPTLPFSVGDTFIHPYYGEVTITAINLDDFYPIKYDGPNCPGRYFVDKIDTVEEFIKQSKPVAPKKEANPKPTKSENTFMKAIKETTLTTIDQNKQAAIIASKMEAGRILNKQIIKQIKPHVHVFLRGYLDTPLAPVILANLVALAGNHTDNKRVKQISEFMLLAAANTTVQSFNLDQIIDDVLKNIKLPAGILDDNEE